MAEITNMRVVSDQEDMIHQFSFEPVALGLTEEINGKLYRVVSNMQTIIVSYEPIEETEL